MTNPFATPPRLDSEQPPISSRAAIIEAALFGPLLFWPALIGTAILVTAIEVLTGTYGGPVGIVGVLVFGGIAGTVLAYAVSIGVLLPLSLALHVFRIRHGWVTLSVIVFICLLPFGHLALYSDELTRQSTSSVLKRCEPTLMLVIHTLIPSIACWSFGRYRYKSRISKIGSRLAKPQ